VLYALRRQNSLLMQNRLSTLRILGSFDGADIGRD